MMTILAMFRRNVASIPWCVYETAFKHLVLADVTLLFIFNCILA